jgi:predicted enzyme related to lactoylglutathione lyase
MDMGHPPGSKGAVVGFEVTDLDGFVQKLKQKAVPFVLDTVDTAVCRMAVIEDPDQNHITIHKRHSA